MSRSLDQPPCLTLLTRENLRAAPLLPEKHEITTFGMMEEHVQDQVMDYGSLNFLAAGGSGVTYAIDEERILKLFYGEGIAVER
ncbi:hypothetical protein BKA63DRAFT_195365 [Paraphoma chrysanthemicola]|nr:hypothetical protein BKA63DRAFT_195365 [Paraphoma chrysanthemicola]